MNASVLLVFAVILYRVVLGVVGMHEANWLHNFSPLAAIALCGAIYFPRRIALAIPLVALFVSDLILNSAYHVPLLSWSMLPQYFALGVISGFGWLLRGHPRAGRTLLASLGGSVLFFFLTNTVAWASDPFYAKSAAGWTQAMTIGHPEFQPSTLTFFRNTLLSDLAFTLLFLLCVQRHPRSGVFTRPSREEELAPW